MHEWERIRSLPSKKKLEKAWKILKEEVWSEKESVWEMNSRGQIERDRRNERRIAIERYIDPSVMLDSWGIERYQGSCRGSGLQQLRYRKGIKQQRVRFKNRSSIDPLDVEELSRRQELSRSIHQVSMRCRDCIKKRKYLRSSTDSKVSRRCRDSLSKQFFEMWKTQIWMQSNIQLNQWSNQHKNLSKLSLNQKKIWAQGSPKHTHTLNKSNKFYISKTSQDSLVSIHKHM